MRNRSLRYGTAASALAPTSRVAVAACCTIQPPVTSRLQDRDVAVALRSKALSHPDQLQEAREMTSCQHTPRCPPFDAPDRDAAHIVAGHPEQGWNLLCNGVVVFDDTGEILPSGACIAPHRPAIHARPLAA